MSDSPSTPTAPEVKSEEQIQTPPADGASSEQEFIKLDPKNLTAEIRRLQAESPDFKQVFNTEVGTHAQRQAARKYEPEINKLKSELESEHRQRRKLEILAMPEKEIEDKFAADPVFAKEYAETVHWKPETVVDDPTPLIQAAWQEIESYARDNGVSQEFIDKIVDKASQGGYESEHWTLGISKLQQDFTNEILRVNKQPDPKLTINPNLTKGGGADLTPAGRGASGGYTFKSTAEFRALPRSEQESILNEPDGMKYVEELIRKG